MGDFIQTGSLPAAKTDGQSAQPGQTATNSVWAADWNAHRDALLDIRAAIRAVERARPAITKSYPLAVKQYDADSVFVFLWKDSVSAQKYLLINMEYGLVTSTQSEGVNGQFWRAGQIQDVAVVYTFYQGTPTQSGTGWTTSTFTLGPSGADRLMPYYTTQTQGDYIEWTGIGGPTVSLGFASSAAGGAVTEVYIDGILRDTFDTSSTVSAVFARQYVTTPGTHTVRVTHNDARSSRRMHVFGPNFFELKDAVPGLTYDRLYSARDDTNFPAYITNNGAHEYAIFNSESNTWAGNYHGGETALAPAVWRLDGTSVSFPLTTGAVRVSRTLSIEQNTRIAWAATPTKTLDTRSRFDFHDSGLSFRCAVSGNVTARDFFTHMTTTSPSFTRVVQPRLLDTTNTADPSYDGEYFNLGRANEVVQEHPATDRKITSWFTLHDFESMAAHDPVSILKNDTTYHKVYYGLCEGTPRTVASAAWESTWMFQ